MRLSRFARRWAYALDFRKEPRPVDFDGPPPGLRAGCEISGAADGVISARLSGLRRLASVLGFKVALPIARGAQFLHELRPVGGAHFRILALGHVLDRKIFASFVRRWLSLRPGRHCA